MESTTESNRIIKVKLVESSLLKTYKEELERWEGEGGNPTELNDVLSEIETPLNPGEVFEVISGEIIAEGDKFFYQVNIKKVE